jgi:hypothetical protein
MRLELRYRSDVELSQTSDDPHGDKGVITLAGVEHCFMYVVNDDVVDTVMPPDYIEQVLNERRQNTDEPRSSMPRRCSQRLTLLSDGPQMLAHTQNFQNFRPGRE